MLSAGIKILRNYLVANLLFFLPFLWVVSWHVPERLEINVRAPAGQVLRVGFLEDGKADVDFIRSFSIAGAADVQTIKSYFADPIDRNSIAFSFDNGQGDFEVTSISVLRHCFIRDTLSGDEFKNAFECHNGVYVLKSRTGTRWHTAVGSDRRLITGVILAEVFILLACGMALLIKTGVPCRLKVIDSSLVAFLVAFFFCVVIPLQSYLVNQSIFDFSLGSFACEALCRFLLTFILMFGALYISECCFGRMMHLVLICAVLYEYFETGLLAIGTPQLNGEIWFFANTRRQFADTLILVGIFGIPIVLYHWIKEKLHWPVLAMLILCIASLFDIKIETKTNPIEGFSKYFASQMDVAKSAVYSPKRNVLVFILDSITVDAASDVMMKDAELRQKFSGVTAFCNNIGMGPFTDYGLPGIMTGKYRGDELDGGDYTYSIFTQRSFIEPYLADNAYVGFINGLYDYGICSHLHKSLVRGKSKTGRKPFPFLRRTNDLLGMNLLEIIKFRMTPFLFKSWYLKMVFMGMDSHATMEAEGALYPILGNAPIDTTKHLTLHVYHTYGSHPPIAIDEHGNRIQRGTHDNYDGFCGQTHFVLRQLGQLFDAYRKCGVYDNSFILICADHGSIFAKPGKVEALTPRAFPMLWVKPESTSTPYVESSVATSHAKIAGLLRSVMQERLGISDVEAMLRSDKRIYREGNEKLTVDVNRCIQ